MLKRNSGFRSPHGYGLIDLLATLAIVGTVSAIAIPEISNTIEGQRVNMELRNVEREMQLARLNAVQSNRPIRVRFNCPSAGYYRRVELLGSVTTPATGDDADTLGAKRCNYTYYPYPVADSDPMTRPNNDGPLRQLNSKVTFTSAQTLEFWPNGTVHVFQDATSTKQIDTPVNIVLSNGSTSHLIAVNGLGKMQFQ
jgi:type II secretory pathway pseudopilin PulG